MALPQSLAEDVGAAIARRLKLGSSLSIDLWESLTARQARAFRVVLARRGLRLVDLLVERDQGCLNCYQDGDAPLCEGCRTIRAKGKPILGLLTRALRENNWHYDGPTEVGLSLVSGNLVHHDGLETSDYWICGYEQVPGDGQRFDVYAVARRLIAAWNDAFE